MKLQISFGFILFLCTIFLQNLTGNAWTRIDRLASGVANGIAGAINPNRNDPNREVDYIGNNDGYIHGLYKRHREKHRERLSRLCEFFRHGRLHRRPCRGKDERERIRQEEQQRGREGDNTANEVYPPKPKPKPQPQPQPSVTGKPCKTTDGLAGVCESATYCFSQYNDVKDFLANRCPLSNGAFGICCPKQIRKVSESYLPIRIPQPYRPSAKIKHISLADIDRAAAESHQFIEQFIKTEKALISKGIFQRHGSTQSQHQAFFGPFDENQFQLTKGGFINLLTTLKIRDRFKLSNEEARDGLWKYSLENTDLEKYCIQEPVCKQSKYRTADGSCNNLQRPLWGKSNTPFVRLLPPAYSDGLSVSRISVTGDELPGARVVSLAAATDSKIADKKFTLFVMQWGQFIDHDLTLTASTRASTGEGLICCPDESRTGIRNINHPSCLPIPIPRNDPFYAKHRQSCMNFVRNAPSPRANCALGHREQMNTLTHIIDGSMVYGSDEDRMKHLREFKGGRLRVSLVNRVEFLPFDSENRSDECAVPERDRQRIQCFVGGDVRVNEQSGLAMVHNLLLREHNRIAGILLALNPNWSDEIVYQEARRIVAAEIQHITYNEWAPLIIGRTVMKEFQILPKSYGYTFDYDPKLNPNIINSFATAAYRFHTLIQGFIELMNSKGQVTERLQLRNVFNNPKSLYREGAYDEYLLGYTAEPTQTFDKFFTNELTEHLFEEHNTGFGMDLIALNLQRGREHGLPGYNEYRKICGMNAIRSFQELDTVMQSGSAQTFSKLYKTVDDIDLFIAGNHEKRLPDAVVGPTFACILAEQHRRNKLGDRFWYENGDMAHSFSEEQLREIRKTSLSRLICDNGIKIKDMQPLGFLQPYDWNVRISCDKLAKVDLNFWKGEKVFSNSARIEY
ncbi:peroxidase-like isoform X2 [Oppia nitens]|uniref:peroxidase-like isoform X2 n=1 Tax=Oppia nitens TaxID=1686743 RepID=UPI0023DB1C02|nr:peroxidase-like isoform X2 [Oppia nitens]